MRRGRILIFVLLIVVVGLILGVVVLQQILQSRQPQQPASVEVYVAGQNIPQGGDITEAVLSTIKLPPEDVVDVMFTRDKLAQLVTNKVARFPLDQGVVITQSMIVDKSVAVSIAGPQWAALVPPGMTAITIPASRISLAGYGIADGAHVNVNGCFLFVDVDPAFQSKLPDNVGSLSGTGVVSDKLPVLSLSSGTAGGPQGRLELDPSLQQPYYLVPSEEQRPRPVCQLLLQDVVVLKTGDFTSVATSANQQAGGQQQQNQNTAAQAPDIVTLIVSPQDSITLSYLIYTNAKIELALRNPNDQSRQATEAATLQFLLSQYNIPVPAKLPYASEPRLDSLVEPASTPAPTGQ
ncbi:MAG TPA: RcpC/CpaB family pilus assembly protein [Anaerolineales bacterium]|nr:RcpC/CpaB family pilus assembly protein [Anaerolineales bacterium]